jgi:predicted RNA-binding protein with TRAM domain
MKEDGVTGRILNVAFVECSSKGEGTACVQGLVIHVADAMLHDRVKVKINRVGGTTAEAEVIK